MQENLGRADEQWHADQLKLFPAPVLPQLDAAVAIQPVQHAFAVEAAGVATEEYGGWIRAPVVAGPGVTQVGDALLNRLGYLEGRA